MTYTLGTAIYNARRFLDDEEAKAKLDAMRAEGYQPVAEATITEGSRYLLRFGTVYVGHTLPTYGSEVRVRAARWNDRIVFMPHRSRVRALITTADTLVKQVSA